MLEFKKDIYFYFFKKMIKQQLYQTSSKQATMHVAAKIALKLNFGDVVYLYGNLGTGKTCFVKGIIDAITKKDNIVKSPTFNIVETYLEGHICHLDLYRIYDPRELEYIDLQQYFSKNTLTLIEWPERVEKFLPQAKLAIHMQYSSKGRLIKVVEGIIRAKSQLNISDDLA